MGIVSLPFLASPRFCDLVRGRGFEMMLIEGFAVCERFALLPNDKKQMIAGELDRSVREIERKISVSLPPSRHSLLSTTSLMLKPKGYAHKGSLLKKNKTTVYLLA